MTGTRYTISSFERGISELVCDSVRSYADAASSFLHLVVGEAQRGDGQQLGELLGGAGAGDRGYDGRARAELAERGLGRRADRRDTRSLPRGLD